MTPDYHEGLAEGLRQALEAVRVMEADVEAKLDQPSPGRTRYARKVRWQAYRNAATRIQTLLRRQEAGRKAPRSAIDAALKRIGL